MHRLRFILRERRTALSVAFAAVVIASVAAAGAAKAFASPQANDPSQALASGHVALTLDRSGSVIAPVSAMMPGDVAQGEIEVGNSGQSAGRLCISEQNLVSTPGRGGGDLSRTLRLTITSTAANGRAVTIYDGPLRVSSVDFGEIPPRQTRKLRFTVTFPDGGDPRGSLGAGCGDNALQGARCGVDFVWTLQSDQRS